MYSGYRSWNAWNVSLWISNDEPLYRMARAYIRRSETLDEAARNFLADLESMGITKTPDGAIYNFTSVRAALSKDL